MNITTLISELQKGNSLALNILYEKYSPALYGVIVRICKNEVLSNEVLQDTFLAIWDKSEQYDSSKGAFYTWAYRIARNKALNSIRVNKNIIQTEEISVYKDVKESEPVDYESLNLSLKELKPHHRRAIELIYFEGLTHKKAHEQMQVPLGTFKSYIKQAVRELKKHYDKTILIFIFLFESLK